MSAEKNKEKKTREEKTNKRRPRAPRPTCLQMVLLPEAPVPSSRALTAALSCLLSRASSRSMALDVAASSVLAPQPITRAPSVVDCKLTGKKIRKNNNVLNLDRRVTRR